MLFSISFVILCMCTCSILDDRLGTDGVITQIQQQYQWFSEFEYNDFNFTLLDSLTKLSELHLKVENFKFLIPQK